MAVDLSGASTSVPTAIDFFSRVVQNKRTFLFLEAAGSPDLEAIDRICGIIEGGGKPSPRDAMLCLQIMNAQKWDAQDIAKRNAERKAHRLQTMNMQQVRPFG